MEKKLITESERTTLFNEWLKTQPMPNFSTIEERKKWWVYKVIEFDKLTHQQFDIIESQ